MGSSGIKADDCKTMKELNAWFAKQKAVIKSYVPAAYANYPLKSLEKTYSQNKARVQHATSINATISQKPSSKQLQTDTETRASVNASITNKTSTEQLAAADVPLVAQIMTCSAIAMVATLAMAMAAVWQKLKQPDSALEEYLLVVDEPGMA